MSPQQPVAEPPPPADYKLKFNNRPNTGERN
jgi:hypothetical protein